MSFTVVIEYTHPEDGLPEQDNWLADSLEDALASIAAARHLDYYVNPVGYVYGADGARVA
jgi:hypothetical protein